MRSCPQLDSTRPQLKHWVYSLSYAFSRRLRLPHLDTRNWDFPRGWQLRPDLKKGAWKRFWQICAFFELPGRLKSVAFALYIKTVRQSNQSAFRSEPLFEADIYPSSDGCMLHLQVRAPHTAPRKAISPRIATSSSFLSLSAPPSLSLSLTP